MSADRAILLACIVGNVLINVLAVEILYQSHVSVAGVHTEVSVHPINGTITAVSPTTNNDTIDDIDVRRFINTSYYDKNRNSTFKHLKCSYGSVSNGTEAACHAAIVLESKSRQKAIIIL